MISTELCRHVSEAVYERWHLTSLGACRSISALDGLESCISLYILARKQLYHALCLQLNQIRSAASVCARASTELSSAFSAFVLFWSRLQDVLGIADRDTVALILGTIEPLLQAKRPKTLSNRFGIFRISSQISQSIVND